MKIHKKIKGKTFHSIKVIEAIGYGYEKRILWKCLCLRCDTFCELNSRQAQKRHDCGCGLKERQRKAQIVHGMKGTIEYNSWGAMKDRCLNKTSKDYSKYGARGITICQRWIDSFEAFHEDMGKRPSKKHSIDRIDTNGNYEPDNCRWATAVTQCSNRRDSRIWVIDGIEYASMSEAMATFDVADVTIRRWCLGFTDTKTGQKYPPRQNHSGEKKYG